MQSDATSYKRQQHALPACGDFKHITSHDRLSRALGVSFHAGRSTNKGTCKALDDSVRLRQLEIRPAATPGRCEFGILSPCGISSGSSHGQTTHQEAAGEPIKNEIMGYYHGNRCYINLNRNGTSSGRKIRRATIS